MNPSMFVEGFETMKKGLLLLLLTPTSADLPIYCSSSRERGNFGKKKALGSRAKGVHCRNDCLY
jgi:hypothetical protein